MEDWYQVSLLINNNLPPLLSIIILTKKIPGITMVSYAPSVMEQLLEYDIRVWSALHV